MPNKSAFEHLNKNLTKYEFDFKKYIIPPLTTTKTFSQNETEIISSIETLTEYQVESETDEKQTEYVESANKIKPKPPQCAVENLSPFQEGPLIPPPKVCTWNYLNKEELEDYLNLKSKVKIRDFIEMKLGEKYPKGCSRIIARELIYSVTKFGKTAEFNLEQIGSLLSMFYLTHRYFTSTFLITAEKVYKYFKDLLVLHCLEYEPIGIKVFNYKESRKIILFFCTIYLRNLPLIKLLSLPNYGLRLDYELKPEPVLKKKKGGDKEKGKKNKK